MDMLRVRFFDLCDKSSRLTMKESFVPCGVEATDSANVSRELSCESLGGEPACQAEPQNLILHVLNLLIIISQSVVPATVAW